MIRKKTVDNWADEFDIEIYDWDAYDFYPEKIVTFGEFSQKVCSCTIVAKDRNKWLEFLRRCQIGK